MRKKVLGFIAAIMTAIMLVTGIPFMSNDVQADTNSYGIEYDVKRFKMNGMKFRQYIPREYNNGRLISREYKPVIFLHGARGHETGDEFDQLQTQLTQWVSAGKIDPVVVFAPEVPLKHGKVQKNGKKKYLFTDYMDYVDKDEYLDTLLNLIIDGSGNFEATASKTQIAFAGTSMGASATLYSAARYYNKKINGTDKCIYSHVGVLSPSHQYYNENKGKPGGYYTNTGRGNLNRSAYYYLITGWGEGDDYQDNYDYITNFFNKKGCSYKRYKLGGEYTKYTHGDNDLNLATFRMFLQEVSPATKKNNTGSTATGGAGQGSLARYDNVSTVDQYVSARSTYESNCRTFVAALYNNCLMRGYSEEEINGWVNNLTSGRVSAAYVAAFFFESDEFRRLHYNISHEEYIRRIYRATLRRDPDQGGFDSWLRAMNSYGSNIDGARAHMLRGAIDSAEFRDKCNEMGIRPGSYYNRW